MPRVPRNVDQQQAVRALIRAGGIYQAKQGKGSHEAVTMPNGHTAFVPYGTVKVGTLGAIIRDSGLTIQQFIDCL